jgi:hypothetical protein
MKKTTGKYDHSTAEGQKRMMAESMGRCYSPPKPVTAWKPGDPDYGADPIGDGTHRMVTSGDIVSLEERCRRLTRLQNLPAS